MYIRIRRFSVSIWNIILIRLTYHKKVEKFPYLDTNQNDLLLSQIQRLTKDPISQTPINDYNTAINKLSIAIGRLKYYFFY